MTPPIPPPPVTEGRIVTASRYLSNSRAAARACRTAKVPFFVTCALLEKESGGRNVYGHDAGGVFAVSGKSVMVTQKNFQEFLLRVLSGETSNGVGPCQITYAGGLVDGHRDGGYFRQMILRGLNPATPHDNILFGLEILRKNYLRTGSWRAAGAQYNGGPKPSPQAGQYGVDLERKIEIWKRRLGI